MVISEFSKICEHTLSIKTCNQLMARYLAAKGIKSYAFTYYDLYPSSQRRLRYSYVSPALALWHHHFIAAEYEDVDQTLQLAKKVGQAVYWDVHEQRKEAKNSKEKKLREESIQFGIHKGVLIPIHGPGDDFAVLVVHQRKNETWLDKIPDCIHEIFIAAHYYYAKLNTLLPADDKIKNKFNLTKRELRCLELTAKNYMARDIAKALDITERTVHYHIQNLNKKMGVKNKYQAIQRARDLNDAKTNIDQSCE